jgi:predicted O-linked N-acetylglucosamine transferase (SPINDLY family)
MKQTIRQKNSSLETTLNRGLEFHRQGNAEAAAVLFQQVLAKAPSNVSALYSLGLICVNAGQLGQASELIDRGIKVAPRFAAMWQLSALRYQLLEKRDEALESHRRAVEVDPLNIVAINNLGALLVELNRADEALEKFRRVLEIEPDNEKALMNCGIMLSDLQRGAEAIPMFERLARVNPEHNFGLGFLCYERLRACDWTDFESLSQQIIDGIRNDRRVCKMFGTFAITDSASDHFLAARIFANYYLPKNLPPLWQGKRYDHQRIRLAYVSPDLREHPVGHLMAGVFERHDKSRFEIIAISIGFNDKSRLRQRIEASSDHFIEARDMTPRQIAQLIMDMEVDIAVDLAGYTTGALPAIFCYRPAPVQVNYLGYAGTMATEHMDYIIADRHVIPPDKQEFYTEKVVYLSDTCLPTDSSIKISGTIPSKAECGLPEGVPVLCAFGHGFKISPGIFDTWMAILKRLPEAILWLTLSSDVSKEALKIAAEERGIARSRLFFAPRVPNVEDHLARYRLADLFLDTFPYNAHTTAADALMSGLPVLTYMGHGYPSRVAGSLLNAIGMHELIATSLDDYEEKAVELVGNQQRLHGLKEKLATNSLTYPLFDTDLYCRKLELAFQHMHAGSAEYQLN